MWITLFVLICQIAGLLTAVHAIMGVRTSQGAIAWAISLITFPYLAVPAYWELGRSKFNGYVTARRMDVAAVKMEVERFAANLSARNLIARPDLVLLQMKMENSQGALKDVPANINYATQGQPKHRRPRSAALQP